MGLVIVLLVEDLIHFQVVLGALGLRVAQSGRRPTIAV
jgi:hypothetical protein